MSQRRQRKHEIKLVIPYRFKNAVKTMTIREGGKVYDINVATALELSLMAYQEAIHYESAIITTAGFDF